MADEFVDTAKDKKKEEARDKDADKKGGVNAKEIADKKRRDLFLGGDADDDFDLD